MGKIRLYWYNQEYNFGDMLNPLLFQKLFGVSVSRAKAARAECMAIGSILDKVVTAKIKPIQKLQNIFKRPLKIWGSGFVAAPSSNHTKLKRKLDIRAVRGTLSLGCLQQYVQKDLSDVVLGDPGLLASRLLDASKIEKKYELGIIPHYVDAHSPLLKNIKVKNAIVIDVTAPVEQTLLQIAQCKHVISSAMHGLIVADAFGIPNVRMVLSDKIAGGDYKFRDYYSAYDMDLPDKIIMTPETKITDTKFIRDGYRVPYDKVQSICKELERVFPYKKQSIQIKKCGVPSGSRTHNLHLRRVAHYPIMQWAQQVIL